MVVNLYKESLKDEQAKSFAKEVKIAIVFGFSQFSTYFFIGGLFFAGNILVQTTRDDGEDAIDG